MNPKCYVVNTHTISCTGHPSKRVPKGAYISIRKQNQLIAKAEAEGRSWGYDLGELNDGSPVNLLIIE